MASFSNITQYHYKFVSFRFGTVHKVRSYIWINKVHSISCVYISWLFARMRTAIQLNRFVCRAFYFFIREAHSHWFCACNIFSLKYIHVYTHTHTCTLLVSIRSLPLRPFHTNTKTYSHCDIDIQRQLCVTVRSLSLCEYSSHAEFSLLWSLCWCYYKQSVPSHSKSNVYTICAAFQFYIAFHVLFIRLLHTLTRTSIQTYTQTEIRTHTRFTQVIETIHMNVV